MEKAKASQSEGASAWRNGLYFGGICALVYIASAFIQDITGTSLALVTIGSAATPLSLLNQVSLVVALVLFFLAGWRTGRADPKLSSAAGAGLIAGLIVSIVEIGTIVVNQAFLYRDTIATLEREKRLSSSGFHFIMFLNPTSGAMFTLMIYVILGAGLGFVGGAIQGQLRQEALWQ